MLGLLGYVFVLLAGFGLGMVFYGGLWATVRALPKSRHATLLALASLWGRTGITIVGLLLAIDSSWRRVLFCLLGFATAKIMLVLLVRGHSSTGRGMA